MFLWLVNMSYVIHLALGLLLGRCSEKKTKSKYGQSEKTLNTKSREMSKTATTTT